MASRHWKCVWFDPIVAVFVHDSYRDIVTTKTVDFAARHFRPDPATEPHGLRALLSAAKGLRNYVNFSIRTGDLARPLFWLALNRARKIVATNPDSADGWKTIGQLESSAKPMPQPSPRFQMPFDPVFDLSLVRATYAFRRALRAVSARLHDRAGLARGLRSAGDARGRATAARATRRDARRSTPFSGCTSASAAAAAACFASGWATLRARSGRISASSISS